MNNFEKAEVFIAKIKEGNFTKNEKILLLKKLQTKVAEGVNAGSSIEAIAIDTIIQVEINTMEAI